MSKSLMFVYHYVTPRDLVEANGYVLLVFLLVKVRYCLDDFSGSQYLWLVAPHSDFYDNVVQIAIFVLLTMHQFLV